MKTGKKAKAKSTPRKGKIKPKKKDFYFGKVKVISVQSNYVYGEPGI